MILWDEEKNIKLMLERNISFEEISEIILKKEYIDILENPGKKNQQIFIIQINNYTYVVPFVIDDNDCIFLKTAYPSRKFHKKYGGQ